MRTKWTHKHNKPAHSSSSISDCPRSYKLFQWAFYRFIFPFSRSQREIAWNSLWRIDVYIYIYTYRFGEEIHILTQCTSCYYCFCCSEISFWVCLLFMQTSSVEDVRLILKRNKIWHWRRWWWQAACVCWQRHQLIWCVLNTYS